eukprot:CAMPEP_0174695664 /NCGR_PEP_ID=MMETSP1094-20130205/2005_1 /TAXON_ID=156173 /ORGANISM="Chrysochromulina brevifilum, Strain UTEX LB 985" /LENGTH=76 /DNA_ID=CAMNT_0015892229 /DNA_START=180 /DNA_END=407 /DNA_ORIENTATION=+
MIVCGQTVSAGRCSMKRCSMERCSSICNAYAMHMPCVMQHHASMYVKEKGRGVRMGYGVASYGVARYGVARYGVAR